MTPFVAIPNTPVEVGQSMTCVVASPEATEAQRRLVEQLFGALGRVSFVAERQLPAAMACVRVAWPTRCVTSGPPCREAWSWA